MSFYGGEIEKEIAQGKYFTSFLSTREWATLIWFLIFLIWILRKKEIRKSISNLAKLVFGKKLRRLWEIILLYNFFVTLFFYGLPIWENIYFKNIVMWVIFSGFTYCINAVSGGSDERYILKIIKENFKLTIFLEFFMSTFTFNIWVELFIIPIVTILTVMNAIAQSRNEYKKVHKILDCVLAIAGLWIMYETIKIGISEFRNLKAINTLVSFMIPIAYTFLMIPLIYVLELYSKYEVLFSRMTSMEENNKGTRVRHRIEVFRTCKFSVRKVVLFQRKYAGRMYIGMKEDEFKQLLIDFKEEINGNVAL